MALNRKTEVTHDKLCMFGNCTDGKHMELTKLYKY
jgi:hypothetical protein